MGDAELVCMLIDQYADLQRILTADDFKKEAERQLKVLTVKLKAMGVVTTNLDFNK